MQQHSPVPEEMMIEATVQAEKHLRSQQTVDRDVVALVTAYEDVILMANRLQLAR